MTKVQRILVPLDHSPGLSRVLDYAGAIARGMGAQLTLLHVYEPPNEMIGIVPGATVGGEIAAERRTGATLLEEAVEILRADGIAPADTLLERASPTSQAIIDRAQRGGFDLIIMGTHARKGVSRLVLGSIAESVLRDAPCPVLTIHLPHE
ncbi:MAG TPA: universal stress protein [Kofleriaceae bacterium]